MKQKNKHTNHITKGTKMKKLFLTALIALFTLLGRETDQSINSPVEPGTNSSPNWIGMPKSADLSVEAEFDVSKNINGANGGSLTLYTSYAGGVHGTISITAELNLFTGRFHRRKSSPYTLMTNIVNQLWTLLSVRYTRSL